MFSRYSHVSSELFTNQAATDPRELHSSTYLLRPLTFPKFPNFHTFFLLSSNLPAAIFCLALKMANLLVLRQCRQCTSISIRRSIVKEPKPNITSSTIAFFKKPSLRKEDFLKAHCGTDNQLCQIQATTLSCF